MNTLSKRMRDECCGTCCDKVDISQQIALFERQRNAIAREAIEKLLRETRPDTVLTVWLDNEYPIEKGE